MLVVHNYPSLHPDQQIQQYYANKVDARVWGIQTFKVEGKIKEHNFDNNNIIIIINSTSHLLQKVTTSLLLGTT